MVRYNRLWDTMKARNITQYKLIKKYGISTGLLDRLRKNKDVSTYTLAGLCKILNCRIEEIVEYIPDEDADADLE